LRFWIALVLGLVSAIFAILTLVWKDWIEIVFGVDPDHHNGSAEWLIVAIAAAIAAGSLILARFDWRRSVVATT
jgi:hypothetical protein